jgi:hypothetical protein
MHAKDSRGLAIKMCMHLRSYQLVTTVDRDLQVNTAQMGHDLPL